MMHGLSQVINAALSTTPLDTQTQIQFCIVMMYAEQCRPASKTNLLRRLQAHTLPDATPQLGRINPFSEISITFEPIQQF